MRSYWARHAAIEARYAALIEHCIAEHRVLATAAGAQGRIPPSGWVKVFRRAAARDAEFRVAERWRRAALVPPYPARSRPSGSLDAGS